MKKTVKRGELLYWEDGELTPEGEQAPEPGFWVANFIPKRRRSEDRARLRAEMPCGYTQRPSLHVRTS